MLKILHYLALVKGQESLVRCILEIDNFLLVLVTFKVEWTMGMKTMKQSNKKFKDK